MSRCGRTNGRRFRTGRPARTRPAGSRSGRGRGSRSRAGRGRTHCSRSTRLHPRTTVRRYCRTPTSSRAAGAGEPDQDTEATMAEENEGADIRLSGYLPGKELNGLALVKDALWEQFEKAWREGDTTHEGL